MICKTPSKVWHKVGASSGEDEVSEFSAYWLTKNNLKFILKNINEIKKLTSLSNLIIIRTFTVLKWLYKRRKEIAMAQLKALFGNLKFGKP